MRPASITVPLQTKTKRRKKGGERKEARERGHVSKEVPEKKPSPQTFQGQRAQQDQCQRRQQQPVRKKKKENKKCASEEKRERGDEEAGKLQEYATPQLP